MWAGRAISALLVVFFVYIGIMNIVRPGERVEEYSRFGFPVSVIPGIGALLVVCAAVYAIPQTAVLGAILLTGYFGGAIVTHMRVGQPFYFEVFFGALIWLGVYLREDRLWRVLPWRYEGRKQSEDREG